MDIKNSKLLLVLCSIVILYVLAQAIFFIRKAWKRGREINISQEQLKKVAVNSVLVSIVPSLPIVISLFVLMQGLGKFFPWLRLSILGSAVYETMVASQTAQTFGLAGISDPGFTGDIFISAMWVMTIAITGGLIFDILFLGKIDKTLKSATHGKNSEFISIALASLFPALLAVFCVPQFMNVGNPKGIVAFFVAAVAVLVLSLIAKATDKKIINEFSMPVGMLAGMAAAIIMSL